MKTLYESLLDDEEDLLDSDSAIISGLLNPKTLLLSRNVFYKKVKETSKKIKFKSEDIINNNVFQAKKIYVLFRPKYPEQITMLYKPLNSKVNLLQMNTSVFKGFKGYRWVICKSTLRIVAGWMDKTYELYELPEKYYSLWDQIHKKINPTAEEFDIK